MPAPDEQLDALTALAEPLRRRLYLFVTGAQEPVSRDSAAAALGVARSVVAFHLDKLAEVGLLEVDYKRPEGRRGPGAGRPAKLYRPAGRDFTFTFPGRDYEVAASLLAQALASIGEESDSALEALKAAARDRGRAMGMAAPEAARPLPSEPIARLLALLSAHAYEPRRAGEVITLSNCPFRMLAGEYPQLVCRMNLALIAGLLDSIEASGFSARLDPAPGRCCVTLVSA